MWTTAANGDTSSGQKRPICEESPLSGHDSSSFTSHSYTENKKRWLDARQHPPKTAQLTLVGTKHDPLSSDRMDIAVADFIFSNALPISLVECTKFQHLIKCARFVPPNYSPPYRKKMTGNLLDGLYQSAYSKEIESLLKQSKQFGVALFGDGATIKKVPLMNFLGSSPNNPVALLKIVDCSNEMASGGNKNAKYIAGLIKPIISRIETTKDPLCKRNGDHRGVVDLLLFDGASNVQKAAKLVSVEYPRITVIHGAEHVVSLFFKDVFTKVQVFKSLSLFSKRCRNVFGSTRHGPHAIFKKQSMIHNKNIYIGFIKISECRMAGELIGLLRLLRLRPILRATISSKEFQDNWAKTFRRECLVLENNEFWKYLFTLCRSLYAPMRILRLADQKQAAMDKLHYYVLQTDELLPKYLKVAESDSGRILSVDETHDALSTMMGIRDEYTNESDDEEVDGDTDDEDDEEESDDGDELANEFLAAGDDSHDEDDSNVDENERRVDRCG
jgi:hypothetical protein